MQRKITIDQSIQQALSYLTKEQKSKGGFTSFSSTSITAFQASYAYDTNFTPALILAALSGTADPKAEIIRSQLVRFLLRQKSDHWSFNYWVRGGEETTLLPYPDDLDDTFCALSALILHDRLLVDEAALARIVKLLIASESQVGGPYYTWLGASVSDEKWRDVDIVVNANVAYFLSLIARPLPHLVNMMTEAIVHTRFRSPYYVGELPIIYFIARSYQGSHQDQLENYILQKQKNGFWTTPLQTALALASLLRLGNRHQKRAITYLLKTQKEDGSWGAEAFCLDPKRDGKVFYNGSSVLTTALVLEALGLYKTTKVKTELPSKQRPVLHEHQTHAIFHITQEVNGLDDELRRAMLEMLHQTVEGRNGNEVTLLPYLVYQSLKRRVEVSERTLLDLSIASTYGWMAYTIYDDFLDEEGDTRLLSVANVAMRRSLEAFDRAVNDDTFRAFVRKTFDMIDAANTWEIIHCRLKSDGDTFSVGELPVFATLDRLAERSFGHALAPLGVLSTAGVAVNSQPSESILRALRHYLIARQLNDDLHDWQEDIRAGRVTYVVGLILKGVRVKKGEHSLSSLLPLLERHFWHKVLPYVCRRIMDHTRMSRRALLESDLLQSENIIENLLNNMELSVRETREKYKRTERFLSAYRGGGE